jgi:hypothetical protein
MGDSRLCKVSFFLGPSGSEELTSQRLSKKAKLAV